MPMDGYACTKRDLLRSQSQVTGSGGGADFDEDVSVVTEMNQVSPSAAPST